MTAPKDAPPPPSLANPLGVTLYGKTANLVRAECAARQMSHDELVRQAVECWALDLARQRRRTAREALEPRIGEIDA